jgi:hypothetical protein
MTVVANVRQLRVPAEEDRLTAAHAERGVRRKARDAGLDLMTWAATARDRNV